MSYDLLAYLSAPCARPELERAFASAFPKQALRVLSWDARGGQLSITLSGGPKPASATIEFVASEVSTPPELDLPRSKARLVAALRVGYSVQVRGEMEVAAAWLACAALALAERGFVLDPQEGVTKTAAEAKRLAARVAKDALSGPPLEEEDPFTPEERAAERLAMFAAQLTRRMKDGSFAQLLDEIVLDEALLSQGLALTKDAERADVSLALAQRAPTGLLAAHVIQASRAPGLRSRLYMEHLAQAGVLDGLPVETQRVLLANLTAQREPELVALLKARRLG